MFFAREAEAGAQAVQPHDVKKHTRQRHGEGRLHRVGGERGECGGGSAVDEGVADEVARHHEHARDEHGRASRDGSEEFPSARGAEELHQQPAEQPFQPFYHEGEEHRRGINGEVGEKRAYPARQHRGDGSEQRRGDKDDRVAAVEKEFARAETEHHRRRHHERRKQCREDESARRKCELAFLFCGHITSEGRRRGTKNLCHTAKERRYPLPI